MSFCIPQKLEIHKKAVFYKVFQQTIYMKNLIQINYRNILVNS